MGGSVQGAVHEGRQPLCDGAAETSEEQAYLQGGQCHVLARAGQAVVLLLLYGRGGTAATAGGIGETGEGDCEESCGCTNPLFRCFFPLSERG